MKDASTKVKGRKDFDVDITADPERHLIYEGRKTILLVINKTRFKPFYSGFELRFAPSTREAGWDAKQISNRGLWRHFEKEERCYCVGCGAPCDDF